MGILRIWLALCVVCAHSSLVCGFKMLPAFHAVGAFFVLAGFLATHVIEGKYKGDYLTFYAKRAIRIWPLYWLVWGVTAGVILWAYFWMAKPVGTLWLWSLFNKYPSRAFMTGYALTQVFCVGQDLLSFANISRQGSIHWMLCASESPILLLNLCFMNVLPQAWTLAVEEYFYMAAPFLTRFGLKWSGALFAAGLALSSYKIPCENLATGFYPPTMLFFFGG
ncbi:MAG TPA: acyltransferase family protein, partial [bacterium]|nr:acyltransferase family protein [bacterium]